jgi:hypothetical protein
MKEYLTRDSKEATGRDKSWNEATYDSIAWRHYYGEEVFKKLSPGQGSTYPDFQVHQRPSYSPPNGALQLSIMEWMDDALLAIGCGRTQPIC